VSDRRRPPRLLVKTLTVAFVTLALLLGVVFVVVTLTVRNQVRQAVLSNLESTQRLFATVETRRQHELRAQAALGAVRQGQRAPWRAVSSRAMYRPSPAPPVSRLRDASMR